MAPRSIFHHINLLPTSYFYLCFAIFTFNLYHKNIKNIILSSLSDLTFASGREGIDNPFIALVVRFLFVCVGAWDFWGASYWIDILVLKNWGKYLRYYCCITLSSSRKTNASSRHSKKDFWHRCRGGLRSSQDIPSTHHKLISLALHYLPFASHFPLPTSTLSFYSPFFRPNLCYLELSFCLYICVLKVYGSSSTC